MAGAGSVLVPVRPLVKGTDFTAAGKLGGQQFGDAFHRDANGKLRDSNGRFVTDASKTGTSAGKRMAGGFLRMFKGFGGLFAGIGLAAFVKSTVSATATFEKSMNTMYSVANVRSASARKSLQKLALQMGKETVFSANEAADAMVELAKAGISTVDIRAGALKGTLLLAAAAGTDMATAATIASNAMNTFGLKGRDMNKVANALAGGANASSASVESLGQALSQVGPGAKNAGLDINETVGALAAFSSAGINGSDAGTSLKTMLQRLVPQTDKARGAMRELGLDFTNADGSFKSLAQISQQLKTHLGGLSQEQKTAALQTIFGSDATRAATVLMNEGAKGVNKYVKATKDRKAAQRAADAGMKGLPGAIEKMKGSFETLQIQLGLIAKPVLVAGFNLLATTLGGVGDAAVRVSKFVGDNATAFKIAGAVVLSLTAGLVAYNLVVKTQTLLTMLATMWTNRQTIAQKALNWAMKLNPIGLVVAALVALGTGLVIAYKKSETFRNIVDGAWSRIKVVIQAAWVNVIKPALTAFGHFVRDVVGPAISWLWRNVVSPVFGFIGTLIKTWWNKGVKPVFAALKWYFGNVLFPVIRFLWNHVVRPIFNSISGLIKTWWSKGVKPTFVALKWYFNNVLFPVVRFLWNKVVKPVFDKVGSGIRWSWEHVIRPVFNALKNFIGDKVVPGFRRGVSAIGDAWNGIKRLAAKPVNFVIDTVYNKGIRAFVNKVAPGNPLPRAHKVSWGQKASGGVLPGYTPGRDPHRFVSNTGIRLDLSGGEAIMRPEFTKAVGGPRGVKRLNALARRGMRFAKGGVVWPLPGSTPSTYAGHDGVDLNAPNDYGKPYYSATSGKVSYVGWNRGYGDAVFVRSPYGELVYGHSSATFVKAGQSVRPGSLLGLVGSTGHSSGPHLHFGFPGGTYAQALALLNGSGGKLPGGLIGQVAGITAGGAAKVVDKVRKMGARLLGKLGDSPFAKMALGAGRKLVDIVADKVPSLVQSTIPKAGATAGAGLFGNLGKNIGHLLGLGSSASPESIVKKMAAARGWDGAQWAALHNLVQRESGWNPNAANPSSSARGLFQKMTSINGPLESTVAGQAKWGLNYIASRYGDPIRALMFHNAHGWYKNGGVFGAPGGIYDTGGHLPTGLSSVFNGTGRPEQILTSQQWADIHALAMRSIEGQGLKGAEVHNHFPSSSEAAAQAAARRTLSALGV